MTRFVSDPDIQSGALCIEGTRIPVLAIWHFDLAGNTPEQIKEQYPTLSIKQIEDAIEHAAELHAEFL